MSLDPATATVDELTGVDVFDDHTRPEVVAWMEPVDAAARRWLSEQPSEPWFRRELTSLLSEDAVLAVLAFGEHRYELRRPSGEAQASVFVVTGAGSERLIDASLLSPDGSVAITSIQLNPSGTVLVWSTIVGGADWATVHFLDLTTREALPEVLTGLKATTLAWTGTGTCAYLQFPAPPAGQELLAPNGGTSIRLHTLTTPQDEDQVLLSRDTATWMFPRAFDGGRRLVVEEAVGIAPARIHVRDPDSGAWSTVIDGEGPTTVVGLHGDELLVATSVEAPDGAVEAVCLATGVRRTVVPEASTPLEANDTRLVGSRLFTVRHGLEESALESHDLPGGTTTRVEMPTGAFITSVEETIPGDHRMLVHIQLPLGPQAVLVHDAESGTTTELLRWGSETTVPVVTELVWATSADGTRVPLRIFRQASTTADGSAAVLLLTYGGYGQHFLASGYQPWQRAWVEAGGVLALAGIRGGGELGSHWHLSATTPHKQRGVDDLVACASWFSEHGWCGPRGVVTNGMSNGGLMVAAAMTQRPDLFAGVVPEVAVLDLLRFHLFTAGHGWVQEFGDLEIPEQRADLEQCSPLHSLRDGEAYPATLLLTADRDDRVPPGPHSYAFFERLRHAQGGDDPVLLRVSRDAGHFTGRSLSEQIDERTAVLTFAASSLGFQPTPTRPTSPEESA
ncbi:prolyl oligopeptidase family serine peptidase [Ornithinimicrobium cavernae]|uniref:prolyl oligopeptidase family serine peptidase n=1 Tax=Ornithinimicrobium cavernae TaxID=2666047 RepID=UPI000D690191|nr:prolyl oligopeptidase family serine peptidase [Ornithinimicrobium cavernae]